MAAATATVRAFYCTRSAFSCTRHVHWNLVTPLSYFSTSEFFTYSSGRSRRRRRRQELRRKRNVQQVEEETEDFEDNRTINDILFPKPFEGPLIPEEERFKWPKSFAVWRAAFKDAWKKYRWTWDGFYSSKGFLVEDAADKKDHKKELQKSVDQKREEVTENVRRNAQFIQEESEKISKEVRERTGINSTEDLKRVAADMMKLASECVKEFMAGYRKGRDDEVEKMLTQYFQDLEEEANKPKRRKPKRRVLKNI